MKGVGKRIDLKEYRPDVKLLAAWGIPSGIMLLLFIINDIFPFGDRSFLVSDMYHQYMPFFSEFIEKVRAGESLFYSWDVGAGSNFLALYIYYLASPLNWLAFLVPADYLIEFMSYLVIFRIGLCGLTFTIYLRKHFETTSFHTVLFSCFYALSGYMAAYNWNIMWLDCVVLLPLILWGLECLVKEGKGKLYCLTLALCIITNYYISIMVCIFLVLYFIVLLFNNQRLVKPILRFVFYSLLAGGMAAVFLVPAACAMLETDFGSAEFPTQLESYFPILDELARHFMCIKVEHGLDHWPNIYCGSAVLILIPLFAVNDAIPIKRRFSMLALAGMMLISFSTNILNFIWHGFNYPNSLPARQSFIYIWLVLVMCYEAFLHIKEMDKKQILYCFLAGTMFLLFCEKFVTDDAFLVGIEIVTLLFLVIDTVLLYAYVQKKGQTWQTALGILAILFVMTETGINMFSTSVGTVSRSGYIEDIDDYKVLYEYAKEKQDGFWRVEKFHRTTKNDGTLAGYPTASVFSSTMNSRMGDLYEELGMLHSKVFYSFDGATGLTSAMLNVQYMFGNTEETFADDSCVEQNRMYTPVINSGGITLYKCNYTLPFGYVVPMDFELPQLSTGDPMKMQNQMIKELGLEDTLFTKVKGFAKEKKVQLTVPKDGYYYAMLTAAGTAKVELTADFGTKKYTELKKNCILYVGYLQEGQEISFVNGDENDESPQISLTIYRMDTDILEKALAVMSEQHMQNITYDSTHISGHIIMDEAGKVMLSIPYDEGWNIMVNGVKTEPELFGECLMMLPLAAGEYDIVMEYEPQGWKLGLAVSALSWGIFAGILIFSPKRRHKKIENL